MHIGEVWLVDLPSTGGKEQSGPRPAVVIQDASYGQASPLVIVVPLTSQLGALRFPGAVRLDPSSSNGLRLPSVAMVFQVRSLDRARFSRRMGSLDKTELSLVMTELRRLTGM
jgi:mRNA interferase MazF